MKRIFKYAVPLLDDFSLDMPKDAKVLSLQKQRGSTQLWALVNDDSPVEKRQFRIFGTGQPIDPDEVLNFIDTFQVHDLVFHLFEVE